MRWSFTRSFVVSASAALAVRVVAADAADYATPMASVLSKMSADERDAVRSRLRDALLRAETCFVIAGFPVPLASAAEANEQERQAAECALTAAQQVLAEAHHLLRAIE